MSATQLVKRLDHRFALLTGGSRTAMPRQQTLRALIDWSYELCSEPERALWARLSVFPAGFDLEAAEAVCPDVDLVLDLLDRLASKSLLTVDRSTEILRYSQLMTVREYGADLLGDGERLDLQRHHRDHYLDRTRREAAAWCGPGQSELLAQWRIDHANLMAALDWSLQHVDEVSAAADLAAALRYHWIAGGNLSNGRIRLDQTAAADAGRDTRAWVGALGDGLGRADPG